MSQIPAGKARERAVSAPVMDLDPAKVGNAVMHLVPGAALLGHGQMQAHIRHYVDPGSPEGRFVCDMLTLSVREIAERWYGGEDAAALTATVINSALLGLSGG